MPKQVWKFILDHTGIQVTSMPVGAEILSVQVQNGNACIWALVDPLAKQNFRTFHTYGTGHPIKNEDFGLKYIGTYQLNNGDLVFHLFEEIK